MRHYPIVKTIMRRLSLGPDVARRIRGVLDGTLDPCIESPACDKWVRSCYNPPRRGEMNMKALCELMDGFGVEAIRADRSIDSYHGDCVACYVNVGETYTPTILHNHRTGSYSITSWGDFVESNERARRYRFP